VNRFDVLTRHIDDLLDAIVAERSAKRSTHGLEIMLRKARSERMRLGLKITRKQRRAA
jgi:hypothetical protein